jgi:UTP:GlnB (protein PII) uridylyltransferase
MDSVGFLVALLKTFAFFSLFPAEVHIDTPGGRVHDRFWLKGLAARRLRNRAVRGCRSSWRSCADKIGDLRQQETV